MLKTAGRFGQSAIVVKMDGIGSLLAWAKMRKNGLEAGQIW